MRELHILASAVHGALVALHSLGLLYNLRKRKWWDVLAHASAISYSARALANHQKTAREPK